MYRPKIISNGKNEAKNEKLICALNSKYYCVQNVVM